MNILLITTDQQRADSLGCTGNRVARTPNIDALASRGAIFGNHHTPNQICSPSRATLFSGRYARHHGLVHNGIALPDDADLLTHDLKRHGYRTYGVGKFHFQPILAPAQHAMPDSNAFWDRDESKVWQGPFFGFDAVDIVIGESAVASRAGHYARWLRETAPDAADLYLPERSLSPRPADLDEIWKCAVPEKLHYNTWITDRACDFVNQAAGETPFFMFVSYPDPHHPFSPPAPWCDQFDPAEMPLPEVRGGELDLMPPYVRLGTGESEDEDNDGKTYVEYLLNPGAPREQGFLQTTAHISQATMRLAIAQTYGMVSMIDACIGRILATLSAKGVADDTLVVFTSDHGELLGDHGLIRKGPAPYRQLLQVPLIMAGPGITPGRRDGLTSHVDVRATIREYVGLDRGEDDGQSFAGNLADPAKSLRQRVLAEFHPRTFAEQYNLSLITDHWRLTIYPRRTAWGELFDRRNDPNEHRNLFHDPGARAVRDSLRMELERDWPPAPDAGLKPIAVY